MTANQIVGVLATIACGAGAAGYISSLVNVPKKELTDQEIQRQVKIRMNRLEAKIDSRNEILSNREKARLLLRYINEKVLHIKSNVSERDKLINAIYDALKYAETGSEKNPWIRTKRRHKGGDYPSTAYGPLQLTNTLVQDYYKRKPELFLDPVVQNYVKRLEEQNKKFKEHGYALNATPPVQYDSRFDYGGRGELGETMADRVAYEQVAKAILREFYEEKGGDIDSMIQRFRGVSKADAPKYYEKVYAILQKYGLPAKAEPQVAAL